MLQLPPEAVVGQPLPSKSQMGRPLFSMWILSHSIRPMALQSPMMAAVKSLLDIQATGIASLCPEKLHSPLPDKKILSL